ncbi:MAG: alpha/beta fold hydrolase [Blastocatellia bacterium]
MYVERYGTGARTYFGLHGWSGDHSTFAPLAKYLPTGATLFSPDLPGYGGSRATRPGELGQVAEALASALEAVESQTLTLIGNCSGALLGLAALERRPSIQKRVERLVLIDPFAYTPWYFQLFMVPLFGKVAYYSTFANPLGRVVTNLSLRGHRAQETDLTHSFRRIDHAVSYRYLEMLTGIGSIERWANIELETDLIHGARTFSAIKQSMDMWQRMWPHARVHTLVAAGHLPILESTEELSRLLFR